MKFVTFLRDNDEIPGILSADMQSVHSFEDAGLSFGDLLGYIKNHDESDAGRLTLIEKNKGIPLSEVSLIAPIPNPHHDIICLGLNYMTHVMESKSAGKDQKREQAVYFAKRAGRAVGPDGVIDSHGDVTDRLDYEAELAVVIGRDAYHVAAENVWDYVFGLMCFNDVSARDIQHRHNQWYFGKSLDTFTVCGPYIATVDEFSLPLELNVQSRVNGETRQNANTRDLIFSVEHVICELSGGITLDAGSIIATGTPGGVGAGFDPPRFMKAGDVCEIEIEGLGVLRNTVR